MGIEAVGIDISPDLPDKPYFIRKGIQEIEFPDNTFDRIFSSHSIFWYDESDEFKQASLNKLALMLKSAGKMQLAPLGSLNETETLRDLGNDITYLTVTDIMGRREAWIQKWLLWRGRHTGYIEFTKK